MQANTTRPPGASYQGQTSPMAMSASTYPSHHSQSPTTPSSNSAPQQPSPSSLPPARVTDSAYQSPIPSVQDTSPRMRHGSSTPLPPPSAMIGLPQDQVNGMSERGNPPTLPPPPPPPSTSVSGTSLMSHSPSASSPMSTSSIPPPSSSIPRPPNSPQSSHAVPVPSPSQTAQQLPTASSSSALTSSQQQQQQQAGGYRPLNVRDALSYLDQVKVKFSDQPDVYNRFLDIMKDFKSQAIDTPGVIERVSTLFRGHPALISGFNTFLPPGYRIECTVDPNDQDVIRVTTPTGTTSTTGGGPLNLTQEHPPHSQYYQHPAGYSHMPQHTPGPATQPVQSPHHHGMPHMSQPPSAIYHPLSTTQTSPGMRHQSTQPPASQQQPQQPASHQGANGGRRAPVEFNHAINYVNKIKNRFSSEPDTYKQFLEILQTYQKEQKPIQEVYAQVQVLFNGSVDLLDEFKQFLPDTSGNATAASSALFGLGDQESPPPMAVKKKRAPGYGEKMGPVSLTKRSKHYHKGMDGRGDHLGLPLSPTSASSNKSVVTAEEIEFFDRIKKYFNNKAVYDEFLKVLNLHTQQIIDQNMLVDQVEPFIGGNWELFEWFKAYVGYDGRNRLTDNLPELLAKPDLVHCQTVKSSPSYRVLPTEWHSVPCSGRDDLCWEVLNDVYVSHPTWASEDSGFQASKKNQHEEALHRCEEERYEYDLNIQANLNAIALMEPLSRDIAEMTLEEKNRLRLPPGLGGQTTSIYQRIIKKVYDKERGIEIIDLLHNNPAHVLPIVLNRLKKKDAEWKKAQREWNKIWRETDAKNFYRALDYQGATFKSNDRRTIVPKALVTEIETLYNDQIDAREKESEAEGSPEASNRPNHQMAYNLNDRAIFKDITRVVFSFLDRQGGSDNKSDRGKIRTFMKTFIPLCFGVQDVVPENLLRDDDDDDEDDEAMDDDDETRSVNSYESDGDTSRSPGSRKRGKRGRSARRDDDGGPSDLLRDVLTRKTKEASIARSRSNSPFAEEPVVKKEDNEAGNEADNEVDNVAEKEPAVTTEHSNAEPVKTEEQKPEAESATSAPEDNSILAQAAAATAPIARKRTLFSLFCNNSFYVFFRQYQLLFERLVKMKELGKALEADPKKSRMPNKTAVDLGIQYTRFDALDLDYSNGNYGALLDLIDKFFDPDYNIEQQMFEECCRYIFGTDAYIMFTIDKLVAALIKQVQTLSHDTKSSELVQLFQSDRDLESTSPRLVSVYRLRAEDIVGSDENLYRINLDNESLQMSVQLLGKDDYMLETSAEDKYENYVASYMDWVKTTEGVDERRLQPTFLKRNLRPNLHDKHLSKLFVRSGMQYKICRDTYHMFYIIGSEDIFMRPVSSSSQTESSQPEITRQPKWTNWLESSEKGWCRSLSDQEKVQKEEEAMNKLGLPSADGDAMAVDSTETAVSN
ncbi:unnamed protein product [Umbelopsis sp. WA50703]